MSITSCQVFSQIARSRMRSILSPPFRVFVENSAGSPACQGAEGIKREVPIGASFFLRKKDPGRVTQPGGGVFCISVFVLAPTLFLNPRFGEQSGNIYCAGAKRMKKGRRIAAPFSKNRPRDGHEPTPALLLFKQFRVLGPVKHISVRGFSENAVGNVGPRNRSGRVVKDDHHIPRI